MGHKLQILEIFFCGHKLQIVEFMDRSRGEPVCVIQTGKKQGIMIFMLKSGTSARHQAQERWQ